MKKIIRYEGLPNEEKFINEFPWYVRQETLTVHKDTNKIMKTKRRNKKVQKRMEINATV